MSSRSLSPHLQGEDGQGSLLFQHSLVEAKFKQTGKWRELLPSRSKDSQKMNWKVDPSLITGLAHAKRLLWGSRATQKITVASNWDKPSTPVKINVLNLKMIHNSVQILCPFKNGCILRFFQPLNPTGLDKNISLNQTPLNTQRTSQRPSFGGCIPSSAFSRAFGSVWFVTCVV